jgi:hypothetical protein
MPAIAGCRVPLSVSRRIIGDVMHAARGVPMITFERRMGLGAVAAARRRAAPSPAWALLMAKGFALVAARHPEFRRAYVPLPWPHLWQADESIASVAVERQFEGEPTVFFGFLRAPDTRPLSDLAAELEEWKTRPVEEVRPFARQVRYARMPLVARRFAWKYATAWAGRMKVRNFGTFAVSLTGSAGATALNLVNPLAIGINTGVLRPDGTLPVRVSFDHRVHDGMPVARALEELEGVLRTELVAELNAMADTRAARIAAATPDQNWK